MYKEIIFLIKKRQPKFYNLLKKIQEKKYICKKIFNPVWLYFVLKKIKPLSDQFGFDRGGPIDRRYIENFLSENSELICGKCLEIRDNAYTLKYGHNVMQSDILDINRENKKATVYGDLRALTGIPDSSYDCVILTQVLQFIDEYEKAISEIRRILAPGGALLATVPAMSRIDVRAGEWGDFWRFTRAGAWHIFQKYFKRQSIDIHARGNCLAGLGFWIGESYKEIPKEKLDEDDPNFPVIITIKAIKE